MPEDLRLSTLGFRPETVAWIIEHSTIADKAAKSEDTETRYLGEWLGFYIDAYLGAMKAWKEAIDGIGESL